MSEHGPQADDETGGGAPVLADVLADDRLVESVASGELRACDASDEVAALLVAWRDQVDAAPVPLHPDLAEAEQALRAATQGPRWRVPLRVLSPVAAAAAAVGIALTGIGWAAHQSTPGDPLWGVSQAIFADHSRSVQAAANVTAELAEAETAIASGTPQQARTALAKAAADLGAVGPDEGRQELERRHAELAARLDAATAAPPTSTTDPAGVPTAAPTAPSASTEPPASTTTPTRPSPTTSSSPAPTSSPTTDPVPTTTPPTTDPTSSDPTTPPTTTASTDPTPDPQPEVAPAAALVPPGAADPAS